MVSGNVSHLSAGARRGSHQSGLTEDTHMSTVVPITTTIGQPRQGKVHGTIADGITTFKGIPYATPPFGANRFLPPQPVEPWSDVRERPPMSLCRCGGSANEPCCDGTHARIAFENEKLDDRMAGRRDNRAPSLAIH
jgi:CDGSH-type Zn-finger protein